MAGVPSPVTQAPYAVETENSAEWNVVAHVRGWCHNSADCAACAADMRAYAAERRLDSIISGA